jgi:hypothetical protein
MPYLTPRQQAGLNNLSQATEDAKLGDHVQGLLVAMYTGAVIPAATAGTIEYPVFEAMGTVTVSGHGGVAFGGSASGTAQQTIYGAASGNVVLLRADFVPTGALAINGTNYITLTLKVRHKANYASATTVGAAVTTFTGGTALAAFTPANLFTGTPGLVLLDGDVLTLAVAITGTLGAALGGKVAFDLDVVS